MRLLRQSLASKLSLGILLMAIPVFAISLGILFVQSRYIVRKQAQERATSVLNTTMQRVNRFISTIETATDVNDWLITDRLQPDALLARSRSIVMLNSNVNGCSITTEPDLFPQYGRYFSAYSVREGDTVVTVREKPYEYFDKVWYKTPRRLGKASWVDPFDDHNEGTLSAIDLITSYCKPLFRPDSQFVGVISTDLSLPRLADVINEEKPYPNAYFVLIGSKGHYFVHPDSTRLFSQTIFSGVDPNRQPDIIALGHEMTGGQEGCMQVTISGQPCLVCYKPVPHTSWSLALVCPDSDILQSYHRLAFILLPLLVIGLIVILLLSRKTVSMAVRPLNRLLDQSQRIAAGHYDEQIPPTKRPDAVGRLQNSFSVMQQSLNRHVSDIRQANEEAARRNEQLAEATYMAEEATRQKTLFIQNMSHQVRTPLNIIMGFAQVLRDSFGSTAKAGEQLPEAEVGDITAMMRHNAVTLNRIVLMLFDSSDTGLAEELASHKHELVSCNQLVRDSIAENATRFPDMKINFVTDVPDTLTIRTNSLYLSRSILELLYNAVKYAAGQQATIRIEQVADKVHFIVEDKGPGMDADYLDLMYKPFTKVNDLSEGLGLGLPLCRRHVINLGGDLILDTHYTKGCRFIIELPIQAI